jgi:galactoside 2-L-fucosyltransferase 1/2
MMNVRKYNTTIFKENSINNVVVVRMVGFWSSFRYFEFIRPQLRKFWKLSTPVSLVTYLVDQMIPISHNSSLILHGSNVTYVGIHVRRGDMKSVSAYRIPGKSYYDRAMKYYDEHYNHQVHFVISTDDIAWWQRQQKFMSISQERISLLSSTLDPILALTLLAQCHHIITSIGTYGWWAAYLSKPPTQTRASPTVYPMESYNTPYWTPDRLRNYLPNDWKGL